MAACSEQIVVRFVGVRAPPSGKGKHNSCRARMRMHALACASRANPRGKAGATSIGRRKPAVGVEGNEGAVRRRLLPCKVSAAPRPAWLAVRTVERRSRASCSGVLAMLTASRSCRYAREAMRRARNSRCLLRRSRRSRVIPAMRPDTDGNVRRGRRSYTSIRTTRRPSHEARCRAGRLHFLNLGHEETAATDATARGRRRHRSIAVCGRFDDSLIYKVRRACLIS